MYGIITCKGCGRNRIIDLADDTTKCPYCSHQSITKNSIVLFSDSDQSVVRDALNSMSGIELESKRKVDESIDPLSTLQYKVEHTSDVAAKMDLISEGLTRIKGEFTINDVEELVPGKGEKYVKAMLTECMIYEVGYGRYRR